MIIIITGTPGTGKSAVAQILSKRLKSQLIKLNSLIDPEVCAGFDRKRETKIVDIHKLSQKIKSTLETDAVIEGHFAHLLPGDVVVVLRTHPKILKHRLIKKKFKKEKLQENLEAEALDVCLIESMERHKNVYEIDTSKKKTKEVVENIIEIIRGKGNKFKPGKIDWSEEFFK